MSHDEPSAEPDLRLEMFSQARYLAAVRAMVAQVAHRLGFADAACSRISLAVDEALCNIIKHGYDRREDGRIWISLSALSTDHPGIHIVLEDRARQVDPSVIRSRDLDDVRPGGLGVHLIREVMDEVTYAARPGGGMRLTLTKRLPRMLPAVAGGAGTAQSESESR